MDQLDCGHPIIGVESRRGQSHAVDALEYFRRIGSRAPSNECIERFEGNQNFGLLVGIGQDGRAYDLLLVPHALRVAGVRMHLHGQWSTRGEDLREDGGLFSGQVIGESFGRVSGVAFEDRRIHR